MAQTVDGKPARVPSRVSQVTSGLFQYFRLLTYAEPTKLDLSLLVIGTLAAIAGGIPFPLIGIVFGQLVDSLNSATCASQTNTLGAQYQLAVNDQVLKIVYLGIAQFGLVYIYVVCWSLFGDRLAHRMRERYLSAMMKQEVAYFDKLPAGHVSARLTADINTIKAGTSEKVGLYIITVSLFVTAYVVAFIKDPKLTAILICVVPAFLLMALIGGHYVGKFSGEVTDHLSAASSIALESLSNIMVVHAFRANDRLEEKFATELAAARKAGIGKAVATAVQSGLLYFIAFGASGLAYWQGSKQIGDTLDGRGDGVGVGTIYTIFFIVVDASLILSQVSPLLQMFGSAVVAFKSIREDIGRPSMIDGTSGQGHAPSEIRGDVMLRNLSFRYPARPDVPVIRDISLHMAAGKHTAVVGLSGSGKSTIAGLLTRLYDPEAGSIMLDGQDLRSMNVRMLRSHIGLVQQDPCLLDRSILENIALGLVNSGRTEHNVLQPFLLGEGLSQIACAVRDGGDLITEARKHGEQAMEVIRLVEHAAELADVKRFLDHLDGGIGTITGPSGDLLSGGQKQRVAIARAVVKDPKILVLDEATSSLDSASERRIWSGLGRVVEGRTLISIAHRLSTIRGADNIVVMRNGRVVEQGSHSTLMDAEGEYASLVNLQSSTSEISSVTLSRSTEDITSLSSTMGASASTLLLDKPPEDYVGEKIRDVETDPEQDASIRDSKPKPSLIRLTGHLLRPHLLWLFIAFFASVIVGGSYTGSAIIFGNTVSALSLCNEPSSIRSAGSLFGLLFFILGVIEFCANGTSWSTFGWVGEKILYLVRLLSFRSVLKQDLEWHQSENRSPSKLLSQITSDSSAVGLLTGSIIGTVSSIMVNFVAAVVLSHIVAWKIAIVCLATVPLMIGAGIMQIRILAKFADRQEHAFAKSVSIAVEAVTSVRMISALALEKEILGTYHRSLRSPRKEITWASVTANFWLALSHSMSNFIYALAYWWGAQHIISGEYTQTQFFIVILALLVSAQFWAQLLYLAPEILKAWKALGRIFGLINLSSSQGLPSAASVLHDEESSVESKSEKQMTCQGMAVTFQNAKFSYPARPHRKVLRGLSLDIRPGQFCALVGPSGAGKSTIIALLEKMYSLEGGVIEIDGFDIASKTEPIFRDDIGLVPQDSTLFDGTIRFNLDLGSRPGCRASDSEIEAACKIANIHDTIMALPNKYETECGSNGGQLSGGQKQRLAIARALIRKPRLLLLDESTSALDAESEKLLQDGLERAARGITVVAIAHRLNTIRKADVIFMIEEGRCVDRGSHEELMARSESYRINVLHQALDG